jgi:hypothetical protein
MREAATLLFRSTHPRPTGDNEPKLIAQLIARSAPPSDTQCAYIVGKSPNEHSITASA